MKKFAYVIAAVAAIAVAAPSIASAETVVVKHGGMHRDHWHPHHHDVVIVKHRHHG
jgi:oxalate decarboxylase/phosphoglucose isomerase-like protein (cupin superfamily)